MMQTTESATCYRWADLPVDRPMELLERRRVIGRLMMLSEVLLKKGCAVPAHSHANEQFAYVVRGRIRFGIGAKDGPDHREMVLVGGQVLHLPSHVVHSAEALQDTVVLDIFSPPSEKTGVDR